MLVLGTRSLAGPSGHLLRPSRRWTASKHARMVSRAAPPHLLFRCDRLHGGAAPAPTLRGKRASRRRALSSSGLPPSGRSKWRRCVGPRVFVVAKRRDGATTLRVAVLHTQSDRRRPCGGHAYPRAGDPDRGPAIARRWLGRRTASAAEHRGRRSQLPGAPHHSRRDAQRDGRRSGTTARPPHSTIAMLRFA